MAYAVFMAELNRVAYTPRYQYAGSTIHRGAFFEPVIKTNARNELHEQKGVRFRVVRERVIYRRDSCTQTVEFREDFTFLLKTLLCLGIILPPGDNLLQNGTAIRLAS